MMDTHEPPLVESVLLEGSLRPVVVGVILLVDVPSPHRRVEESLTREDESKESKLERKEALPM